MDATDRRTDGQTKQQLYALSFGSINIQYEQTEHRIYVLGFWNNLKKKTNVCFTLFSTELNILK